MRVATAVAGVALALAVAGCQDITAPQSDDPVDVAFDNTIAPQTGPTNQCYGQIIAGIARTWPWAHDGHTDFAPPKGAVALWVDVFGPGLGISSVRELQEIFCPA